MTSLSAQRPQMYDVGPCPICGNGLRSIRICCDQPVVLCDECDAVWSSPALSDRMPAAADPACHECGHSLWGDQTRWATREEIELAGWWSDVRQRADTPRSTAAAADERDGAGIVSRGAVFVLLLLGSAVAALAVL